MCHPFPSVDPPHGNRSFRRTGHRSTGGEVEAPGRKSRGEADVVDHVVHRSIEYIVHHSRGNERPRGPSTRGRSVATSRGTRSRTRAERTRSPGRHRSLRTDPRRERATVDHPGPVDDIDRSTAVSALDGPRLRDRPVGAIRFSGRDRSARYVSHTPCRSVQSTLMQPQSSQPGVAGAPRSSSTATACSGRGSTASASRSQSPIAAPAHDDASSAAVFAAS